MVGSSIVVGKAETVGCAGRGSVEQAAISKASASHAIAPLGQVRRSERTRCNGCTTDKRMAHRCGLYPFIRCLFVAAVGSGMAPNARLRRVHPRGEVGFMTSSAASLSRTIG